MACSAPGIPCFHNVHCDATCVFPGGVYYDLFYTNSSQIEWNGWGGIFATDGAGADCYDAGAPPTAGAVFQVGGPGGRTSPGIGRAPGTYPLEVWGHISLFGGRNSTIENASGGGSLTVSCPSADALQMLADGGRVYTFHAAVGVPLVGPQGGFFIDFLAILRDQFGSPINWPFIYNTDPAPPGLTFSAVGAPSTGAVRLSGTPTTPGVFPFVVAARPSLAGAPIPCGTEAVCTLLVGCPDGVIAPTTLPSPLGTVGVPIAFQLFTAAFTPTPPTGTTLAFTATGLPPGLSILPTGVLFGTPAAAGTFPFTLRVTLTPGGCYAEQSYSALITGGSGAFIPSGAQLFPPTLTAPVATPPSPVCADPGVTIASDLIPQRRRR